MGDRVMGSRRTRQEGVTVAKRPVRAIIELVPFSSYGLPSVGEEGGPYYVMLDIELARVRVSALVTDVAGITTVEVKKNGVTIGAFDLGNTEQTHLYDIEGIAVDKYFFAGPGDYITVIVTAVGGHENIQVQMLAYDNEGR